MVWQVVLEKLFREHGRRGVGGGQRGRAAPGGLRARAAHAAARGAALRGHAAGAGQQGRPARCPDAAGDQGGTWPRRVREQRLSGATLLELNTNLLFSCIPVMIIIYICILT